MKKIVLFFLLAMATQITTAQDNEIPVPSITEQCATVPMHQWRVLQNPNIATEDEFETWMAEKIKDLPSEVHRLGGVVTIPVVVHVIHNGEPVGVAPNIPDAQVASQIKVLNEDFRRLINSPGFNEHPDGADAGIEFCLAQIDPNGAPTSGINRVNGGQANWSNTNLIDSSLKPSTIWNPDQYFNIWVCNLGAGLLGYAQFPVGSGLDGLSFTGGADSDGIVIGYPYFGSENDDDGTFILDNTYALGRTATHEAGHWLGLRHIWGDGGCGADDYCADTPESDASNGGCPTGHQSCGTVDMIENYMDYTADYCMNIFTNDQVARMQTVLLNSPRRNSLLSSIVCTPPPTFTFSGQVIDGSTGLGVKNAVVQLRGTFSPTVLTDVDGNFTLELVEGEYSYLAGKWGYQTLENNTNQFLNENAAPLVITLGKGYYDDFALDYGWIVSGDSETGQWVRGAPAGSTYQPTGQPVEQYDPGFDLDGDIGFNCYLTGNSGGGAGQNDVDNGTTTLTSPEFDLTTYTNPAISFYRWFAIGGGTGAAPDDILEIRLSNGTETVTLGVADITSSDLRTWAFKEYLVSDYLTPTSTMRLIVTTSDQVTSTEGHLVDAAFDLFQVTEGLTPVQSLLPATALTITPNPSQGQFAVSLDTPSEVGAIIEVFNTLGQNVYRSNMLSSNPTKEIDLSRQATGIYFVKVTQGNQSITKKILIQK